MYYAYPQIQGPYALFADRTTNTWKLEEDVLYNWATAMNGQICETNDQGHGSPTEQTETIQGICLVIESGIS